MPSPRIPVKPLPLLIHQTVNNNGFTCFELEFVCHIIRKNEDVKESVLHRLDNTLKSLFSSHFLLADQFWPRLLFGSSGVFYTPLQPSCSLFYGVFPSFLSKQHKSAPLLEVKQVIRCLYKCLKIKRGRLVTCEQPPLHSNVSDAMTITMQGI